MASTGGVNSTPIGLSFLADWPQGHSEELVFPVITMTVGSQEPIAFSFHTEENHLFLREIIEASGIISGTTILLQTENESGLGIIPGPDLVIDREEQGKVWLTYYDMRLITTPPLALWLNGPTFRLESQDIGQKPLPAVDLGLIVNKVSPLYSMRLQSYPTGYFIPQYGYGGEREISFSRGDVFSIFRYDGGDLNVSSWPKEFERREDLDHGNYVYFQYCPYVVSLSLILN